MRGKRTDSEKVAEVISKKISDPDITLKEIENETGVNYSTASRIVDKIPEVAKSCKKFDLIDINLQIIEMGKKLILEKMPHMDVSRMSDLNQASQIMETAFKQNQLLTGGITENVGVSEISEEQKAAIAARFAKK